jgi:hypothetical protein
MNIITERGIWFRCVCGSFNYIVFTDVIMKYQMMHDNWYVSQGRRDNAVKVVTYFEIF